MRKEYSFNNEWLFALDTFETKPITGHFATYMHSKARHAVSAGSENFYDKDFEVVNLPHDYVLTGSPCEEFNESQGSFYRKNAWYRKHFKLEDDIANKRVVLLFEGAGRKTTVWVNEHLAGFNTSMYNSFFIDITNYINRDDKVNTIAVHIENKDTEVEGWWYEGAGLYRNVKLIVTDEISVDVWGTYVNPVKQDDGSFNTEIETTIYSNAMEDCDVTVKQTIKDNSGNVIATDETCTTALFDKTTVKQNINVADPTLWNLDAPTLYTLVTEIIKDGEVCDTYETAFGYRTIAFDPEKGFFLNGKNIKIRGACMHQDHANLGVAVPDSVHEFRLRKMKEYGFNGYRAAHHNPAPAVLKLCDEIGIVVLDENRWFNYSEDVKRQIVSMVKRDRNHPCVIGWAAGNEEPIQGQPVGRDMVNTIKRFINKYDTTRPVTLALNGGFYDSYAARACDTISINYNLSGYDKFPIAHKGKSFLATESGASNNNRGIYFLDNDRDKYKSSYATAYDEKMASFGSSYIDAIEASETHDFIGGTFIWSGMEYRGEAQWPKLFSGSGAFDSCGFEKDNAYMIKSLWCDEPSIHIMPHWDFPDRVGQIIPMVIYTNADEVELIVNGESLGKKSAPKFAPPTWDVAYQPGYVKAIGYKNGEVYVETTVETTSAPAKLVLTQESRTPLNNGEDTVFFHAHLEDEKGRTIPTANERVFFTTDENATIISVSGGDPLDHEDTRACDKKMFGGLVQVILAVKKGVDKVSVTANIPALSFTETISCNTVEDDSIKTLKSCQGELDVTAFRIWPLCDSIDAVNATYNFADMNTSEPITPEKIPTYYSADDKFFTVTARTVFPEYNGEKPLSLRFENLCGTYSIKIFHDEDCWPSPEPDVFVTLTGNGTNETPENVNFVMKGFSKAEKIKMVITAKNDGKFSFDKVHFDD